MITQHRVEWDEVSERLRLICEAPPDARCKWEPTCRCESYTGIEQAPDGTWSHLAYDSLFHDGFRHFHTQRSECHFEQWWHGFDLYECGPRESFWVYDENDEPIPPPVGPVSFTWTGEGYEWSYVKEEPV